MKELILQVNDRHLPNQGELVDGRVYMTPPIDEDYWYFRVEVAKKQAVVGFPKFSTIGIGFQYEHDWNSNLPYTVSAERIYEHSKHNKGEAATREDCIRAIEMIREAARALNGMSDEEWAVEQERMEVQ